MGTYDLLELWRGQCCASLGHYRKAVAETRAESMKDAAEAVAKRQMS